MTVQEVYDIAIHLMDEQNESTGQTETVDTKEYKFRTISILNTAIPRLFPYSSNYSTSRTGRPESPLLSADDLSDPDFDQDIELDQDLCAGLLPLYLASQLLSAENVELAAWFYSRYQEGFNDLKEKIPSEFETIPLPYGGF